MIRFSVEYLNEVFNYTFKILAQTSTRREKTNNHIIIT